MSRFDGDPSDPGLWATPGVRVLAEAAVLAVVAIQAWILAWFGTWKCDDTCTYNQGFGNPTHESWRHAADSWQWDAIALLGGLGFVAAVLWVVALRFARPPVAAALGGLTAALILIPWTIALTSST